MPGLVEYAAGKLFRLVCPAGVGRLPDPFHRRFSCCRPDDIPTHGNDLREPLIRFISPHLIPYGPLDLMSSVTVPII